MQVVHTERECGVGRVETLAKRNELRNEPIRTNFGVYTLQSYKKSHEKLPDHV